MTNVQKRRKTRRKIERIHAAICRLIWRVLMAWVILSVGECYALRRSSAWNVVTIIGNCIEQEWRGHDDYIREEYGAVIDRSRNS